MQLCSECNERQVQIDKWGVCLLCYGKLYRAGKIPRKSFTARNPSNLFVEPTSRIAISRHERDGEIEFIRNYFHHKNWISHPATFHFDGSKYSPDFYDAERNVFIEVSATRQAYHSNKEKYDLFRQYYPFLNFEIRKPTGELLNEDSRDKNW